MDGTQFEEFLAVLFVHLGYRVQHVGMSHDFGADLVLTSSRKRIVVQAKRYSGNVGIGAVQEALGAVQYYHGTRGMVVASSGFTESARELAARSGIELWDRQRLAAAMARIVTRGREVGRKPACINHEECAMKIATWNVNSVRARLPVVQKWWQESQVDVLAMQETKTGDETFPVAEFEALGYQVAMSGQKTYNGVAIASRLPISRVVKGWAGNDLSRILAVDVGDVTPVSYTHLRAHET